MYTFLIFVTYHPKPLFLHEQDYEDPWYFFSKPTGVREQKGFGNSILKCYEAHFPQVKWTAIATDPRRRTHILPEYQ
jgi:hypothetical protein